jgi:uncharacterized protein YeaO (DUF488 family)
MVLYTKCILKPRKQEDGIRISVMSRHTLQDGKTPDERIIKELYDEHKPNLAPPAKLIGSYYKRGLGWEEFAQQYLEYLKTEKVKEEVKNLAQRALRTDITILCIEDSPEYCHRRLLSEECGKYEPNLIIKHL